jgi:hypothetical protein
VEAKNHMKSIAAALGNMVEHVLTASATLKWI